MRFARFSCSSPDRADPASRLSGTSGRTEVASFTQEFILKNLVFFKLLTYFTYLYIYRTHILFKSLLFLFHTCSVSSASHPNTAPLNYRLGKHK